MSLSTLSFYCNRPTVVACLNLVTAITAEVQPKKDEEGAQNSSEEDAKDSSGSSDIDRKGKNQEADKEKGGDEKDSPSTSANADGVSSLVTTINPKVVGEVDEHGNPKIAPKKLDSVVKGLLGKGKDRVVFLLVLDMELAEIVLNKEDGSPLSTLSQDNFHTDVKVLVMLHSSLFGFVMSVISLSRPSYICQRPSYISL